MNKVEKTINDKGEISYTLYTESNPTKPISCKRWFEKKVGVWHVQLPKDNESGRTYIRESNFDSKDTFEFETKTEHRTGLTSGGWRSKMTDDEKAEVEKAEATIERIKKLASSREVEKVDPNSVEGIEAQIARLLAKKAKLQK